MALKNFASVKSKFNLLLKGYKYDLFKTRNQLARASPTLPLLRGRVPVLMTPEPKAYIRELTKGIEVIIGKPKESLKLWLRSSETIELLLTYKRGKRVGAKKKKIEIKNVEQMIPLLEEYKEALVEHRNFLNIHIKKACEKAGTYLADYWVALILKQEADIPIAPKSGATMILHPEGTEIPLIRTGYYVKKIEDVYFEERRNRFIAWIGFRKDEPLEGDPELGDAQSLFELFRMNEFGFTIIVNDKIRALFRRHGINLKKDVLEIPPRPYFRTVVKRIEPLLKELLLEEGVEIEIERVSRGATKK